MNNHIRFCQIVLALCLEHLHDNLQVQHHLRERSERQDAEMEMVNGRPLKSICRYVQSFLKKIVIQGGFFNWSAQKMTKYEEKLKYLNWSANCSSRKVLSVNPQ